MSRLPYKKENKIGAIYAVAAQRQLFHGDGNIVLLALASEKGLEGWEASLIFGEKPHPLASPFRVASQPSWISDRLG